MLRNRIHSCRLTDSAYWTKATRQDARLDPLVEHYAARTQGLRISAVRVLFAVTSRSEIVSLASGIPNVKDLPLGETSGRVTRMVRDQGTQVMQYDSGQSGLCIREQICEAMAEENSVTDPDDTVVTAGSQQGLDLATRVFCDPGDMILARSSSYVGALGTFQSYQIEAVHVACNSEGLTPEVLIETVEHLKKQGKCVKLLYTTPNFNDPSGVTQSVGRRRRVIESCAEAGVLAVENSPYGLLTLDSSSLPAVYSLDTNAAYLGLFSKTFTPGLHAGWTCTPHGMREHLVLAQESAALCPPVFFQFAISNYLGNCDWRGQIGVFQNIYRTRHDAMLATLEWEIPGDYSWAWSAGGSFVWAALPEGLDASTMLPHGVGAHVTFVPGPAFFADGRGSRSVRLSHCLLLPGRTVTGVERFVQVLRSELETLRTFDMHIPSHASPTKGPGPNLN